MSSAAIASAQTTAAAAARVIVNADDFGLHPAVNEAVRRSYLDGVLSSTSLLVHAPATAAAVALARGLPGLGVGLHLALTELAPLTAAPHLAPGGRFPTSHATVFRRLLCGRVPREEIRAEVEAQVAAALATGLDIDHIDGHGHVHLLPGVLEAVVEACQAHGIEAIRWPWEPGGRGAKPWLLQALCRRGARVAAELARPVALWGLTASGQLTTPRLAAIARRLPPGVSEIMVHPATADEVAYPGYLGAQELAALLDASIAAQLPAPVTFGALARPATR